MLRFLSDEKYIKIYWSVRVANTKKKKFLKFTLQDGSVARYTKDKQGHIQYYPEKDLDPKIAKARWDELYDKVYKRAGTHQMQYNLRSEYGGDMNEEALIEQIVTNFKKLNAENKDYVLDSLKSIQENPNLVVLTNEDGK